MNVVIGLASTTGLLDIHQRRWDVETLSLAGIKESQLSPLVSAETVVSSITVEAARSTGLLGGLLVVAGGSDGGMAMVGTKESPSAWPMYGKSSEMPALRG
jgi:gluconokinase